jgi:hypothetical protein
MERRAGQPLELAAGRAGTVLSVPRPGLWNNAEFLSLWAGQTISLLGDQVSNLALL